MGEYLLGQIVKAFLNMIGWQGIMLAVGMIVMFVLYRLKIKSLTLGFVLFAVSMVGIFSFTGPARSERRLQATEQQARRAAAEQNEQKRIEALATALAAKMLKDAQPAEKSAKPSAATTAEPEVLVVHQPLPASAESGPDGGLDESNIAGEDQPPTVAPSIPQPPATAGPEPIVVVVQETPEERRVRDRIVVDQHLANGNLNAALKETQRQQIRGRIGNGTKQADKLRNEAAARAKAKALSDYRRNAATPPPPAPPIESSEPKRGSIGSPQRPLIPTTDDDLRKRADEIKQANEKRQRQQASGDKMRREKELAAAASIGLPKPPKEMWPGEPWQNHVDEYAAYARAMARPPAQGDAGYEEAQKKVAADREAFLKAKGQKPSTGPNLFDQKPGPMPIGDKEAARKAEADKQRVSQARTKLERTYPRPADVNKPGERFVVTLPPEARNKSIAGPTDGRFYVQWLPSKGYTYQPVPAGETEVQRRIAEGLTARTKQQANLILNDLTK